MGRSDAFPILSLPVADGATCGNPKGTFYHGFGLSGAPCQVRVREGSATGKIIDSINLSSTVPSMSETWEHPVYVDGVIYIQVVAGTPEGAIRWR
jgi:hypothetical protein